MLIKDFVLALAGTQSLKVLSNKVAITFGMHLITKKIFLGTYESGIASYKHMYFNATQNTLKIWVLIVLGIIAMYECIKLLVFLIIQNKVRYSMILLFGLSIFSHYYGWWAYINYYNDEYYSQWNHQLFFSVSYHD